jgi:large subunit ribosomal protein L29
MKNSEITQLTNKELEERINDERNMMTRVKLNHTISPLDNPMKIKESRKVLARLLTEKRRRELDEKVNS